MADQVTNSAPSSQDASADHEVEVPVSGRKEPRRDPHAVLTGRPPIQEYLGIAQQSAEGSPSDIKALMDEWRKGSDRIAAITPTEAGLADGASMAPVPAELDELRERYVANPVVMRAFAALPFDVKMINLDEVVVFQKMINLTYAKKLGASLQASMSAESLMKFSLGIDQVRPPVRGAPAAQNAFSFLSESLDLRVLDVSVLNPTQITGFTPQGQSERVIAIVVGYGTNALNLAHVNGRLILNNGSHRAYALHAAGFRQVPAVVQEISHVEELAFFPPVKDNADVYLVNPRPPMLRDYFDRQLHTIIDVPRKLRHVRVVHMVEVTDAPAMD